MQGDTFLKKEPDRMISFLVSFFSKRKMILKKKLQLQDSKSYFLTRKVNFYLFIQK